MNASDLALLFGAVCIAGGIALVYLPAGIVVWGAFMVLIGLGVARDR